MPEFPAVRRERFQNELGLSAYDAGVIINQGQEFADYFEAVAAESGDAKQSANWVTQNVLRELNERSLPIDQFPVTRDVLAVLVGAIARGTITIKSGRDVFDTLLQEAEQGRVPTSQRVMQIITEQGLEISSSFDALDELIDAAAKKNTRAADDVRAGKLQAAGPLIGMVMGQLKGADPKQVRDRIIERLRSS
jgi:aspartyl-tRNA(Asn)/glutamyl-tRNA(Gln) amidotransferase subunit B